MKKIVIGAIVFLIMVFAIFFFLNSNQDLSGKNQVVLEKTLDISRSYVALRYQTDNVLINARNYSNYEDWKKEMDLIINKWSDIEKEALSLENLAIEMADEKISFRAINKTLAYDKQEISNVFDKAPAGKKIATLAEYLGVDAKKAYAILKQDQAQAQADAWNEAGDTFQKLETTAVVVKNACKVTTFVGTIALTGGTSAIMAGSTLGKVAVVVAGADLTLEVTDDTAKIALGDKNKISTIVGSAREVTEPVASILMISTLPKNLTKGIDKLGAVTFGAEQLNGTVQDGKVIGIKLPAVNIENGDKKHAVASVLEKEEVKDWLKNEAGSSEEKQTEEDIEDILGINEEKKTEKEKESIKEMVVTEKQPEETKSENNQSTEKESVIGVWEGILKFTPNKEDSEQQKNYILELNSDGTVGGTSKDAYGSWKLEGNLLKLIIDVDGAEGYDEFILSGNTLTYVKRAGINSEGVWQEDLAGSDFFGGKFMEINLEKL